METLKASSQETNSQPNENVPVTSLKCDEQKDNDLNNCPVTTAINVIGGKWKDFALW